MARAWCSASVAEPAMCQPLSGHLLDNGQGTLFMLMPLRLSVLLSVVRVCHPAEDFAVALGHIVNSEPEDAGLLIAEFSKGKVSH